jgi:hypothetical protein
VESLKDLAATQTESKTSASLHRILSREMSAYNFYLDAEKQQKLIMRREPVLRYPAPPEGCWGEIYVWTDRGRAAVVGCVFVTLLVLEAQRKGIEVRWNYAPVRFTNRTAWVSYKGKEVWRVAAASKGIFDGVKTTPYGTFYVKTIELDVDGK